MYSGGLKLPLPEGTHTALKNHFTTLHSAMADEHRPKGKFYELLELITSPAYQRRGIGASLIQYGLEKADKEGVPCYLTASPMGAPLYKKVGFEEVGRVEVELEQFGGEKGVKHVHLAMIRPARKLENGTSS
ncbi:hypothetical protein B0J14DRAFT_358209 [Halenospora varia]|nr:hypothetical protein B0J14DRAFT_358209 [Halenospora varia]